MLGWFEAIQSARLYVLVVPLLSGLSQHVKVGDYLISEGGHVFGVGI